MITNFLTHGRRLRDLLACALLLGSASTAFAQVETATSTPTKVYASVGGSFTFGVAYTGGEVATTDLAITYTPNTTSPVVTPNAACVSVATPAPYTSANPNELYVLWEPAAGTYPANCGGAAGAAAMASFTGVASTLTGGKYTITVLNNASLGAANNAANDVTVCQKRTVASITPPANFVEGAANTGFIITLDQAVVAGCGGFSVPYTISGAAVAGKTASVTPASSCAFADGATSCTVSITTVDNATFEGTQALVLTVTDSVAASTYVSASKTATTSVLDNEVAPVATAPTVSALANVTLTGGTGTVPVNVATAGTATASVALACTIPAGTASFAVTAGGTRTINAPATVGANAPAIGLSCTPQATLQTQTLTCTQFANPAPNPANLTATITCPAASPAAVTAATPAGPVTLPSYSVSSTPTRSSTTLSFTSLGGASSVACNLTNAAPGYTTTPNPLVLSAGSTGLVTVTYTGAVVGTFTGTLTCTPTAPATGGPFVYNLSTTVQAAQVIAPTVQVPTMGTFGLGLLGLLVAGLAGFMQRRRAK